MFLKLVAAEAAFLPALSKKPGIADHVSLQQKDYRDIEAVGGKNWPTFFEKVGKSVKTKESVMIQAITIQEDLFYSYRKSTDFIQQSVFPGGML